MNEESADSLGLDGSERFSLLGPMDSLQPLQEVVLKIERTDGTVDQADLRVRIDTPIEVEYYRHGGILQYVLRSIVKASS